MGITSLWAMLNAEGLAPKLEVCSQNSLWCWASLSSAERIAELGHCCFTFALQGPNGEHPHIMRHVSGKAVAVDLSVWLMQVSMGGEPAKSEPL